MCLLTNYPDVSWGEVFKVLPGIVTACTAIWGVMIARAGLHKWRKETIGKRKAELAEEVLADFYQAYDIIDAARSPAAFGGEGESRKKEEWENENDTRTLNAYFVVLERLSNRSEFFAQFQARRYRFKALFGDEAIKPFNEFFHIRSEIIVAVRMLIMTYRQRRDGSLPKDIKNWEETIGWRVEEEDVILTRLKAIVDTIEKTCRPAIQENASQ